VVHKQELIASEDFLEKTKQNKTKKSTGWQFFPTARH